jgi:hypothetical protein
MTSIARVNSSGQMSLHASLIRCVLRRNPFAISIDGSFLQCVGVLKLMVENAQAQDEVLKVDMTPTLYSLATFINSFNNLPAYRIRLKFCALCDSVFSRPDMLRKDSTSSHRQKILDILLGWIQDPTLVRMTAPLT